MAIRYTDEQKKEVVDFVVKYNKENGRGGQSAAVKKFDINPITVASWLKNAGVKTPGKKRGAKGAKSGVKAAAPKQKRGKKSKAAGGNVVAVLDRLQAIQGEIDSLQAEFDELKSQI